MTKYNKIKQLAQTNSILSSCLCEFFFETTLLGANRDNTWPGTEIVSSIDLRLSLANRSSFAGPFTVDGPPDLAFSPSAKYNPESFYD